MVKCCQHSVSYVIVHTNNNPAILCISYQVQFAMIPVYPPQSLLPSSLCSEYMYVQYNNTYLPTTKRECFLKNKLLKIRLIGSKKYILLNKRMCEYAGWDMIRARASLQGAGTVNRFNIQVSIALILIHIIPIISYLCFLI